MRTLLFWHLAMGAVAGGGAAIVPQKPLVDASASLLGEGRGEISVDNANDGVSADREWPIYWQDERTCDAQTKQFTGRVPVSEDKSLFFWFVEARDKASTAPTLIWLNGGPGGSSLPGLFEEIGPCQLVHNRSASDTNTNWTTPNSHSWADFANLLFLDQPAGVGFSTALNESMPLGLQESSRDFSSFLSQFVAAFPRYFASREIYLAGESFGGRYVPRYVADIVRGQLDGASSAIPIDIHGVILVDAFVDAAYSILGHYELFCTDGAEEVLRFNDTACEEMAAAVPEMERLARLCQLTRDPYVCKARDAFGREKIERYFWEEVESRRRSPYDFRRSCEVPPICIPPEEFTAEEHLNRPEIKKLIGVGAYENYSSINFELNRRWNQELEIELSTTADVVFLLEEGGKRLLALNGKYDAAITTPGMWREFDELPWRKSMPFRLLPRKDWYWTSVEDGEEHHGGEVKMSRELTVASVDNAGHMSPGDAKESVSWLVGQWISGGLQAR